MMARAVDKCSTCGETREIRSKQSGQCSPCYMADYHRAHPSHSRNQLTPSKVDAIEVEIAKGTPTRDIMSRLDVDYGAVKTVRDNMDEEAAS